MEGETWENCIALLRAGAAPTDVLPNVRALFHTLPEHGVETSRTSPDGDGHNNNVPTTSAAASAARRKRVAKLLQHRLDTSKPPFPIPYLRPPPFVWELLRDADGRHPIEYRVFDSELDIHLLDSFQPLFVHPPPPSVCALLHDEKSWRPSTSLSSNPQLTGRPSSHSPSHDQAFPDAFKLLSVMSPSTSANGTTSTRSPTQANVAHAELLSATSSKLSNLLRIPTSKGLLQALPETSWPLLSTDEWAFVISAVSDDVSFSCFGIEHLVRAIHQSSFAVIALHTLIPLFAASEEQRAFVALVRLAVDFVNAGTLSAKEVAELVQVYRNVEDGATAALAQMAIVDCLGRSK